MEAGRRVGHRGAAVLPRHTPPSQTGGEGVNRPHRIGHHASPPPRKILYPRRSYLFVLLGEGGAGVKPHSGKGRDLYWQAVGAGWMANPLRGRNGEAPPWSSPSPWPAGRWSRGPTLARPRRLGVPGRSRGPLADTTLQRRHHQSVSLPRGGRSPCVPLWGETNVNPEPNFAVFFHVIFLSFSPSPRGSFGALGGTLLGGARHLRLSWHPLQMKAFPPQASRGMAARPCGTEGRCFLPALHYTITFSLRRPVGKKTFPLGGVFGHK